MGTTSPVANYNDTGASAMPAASAMRTRQVVTPANGDTVAIFETGNDGMLILTPTASIANLTLSLPNAGDNLQIVGIYSTKDVSNLTFTNGTMNNGPTELLANQAVEIQRLDKDTKNWTSF